MYILCLGVHKQSLVRSPGEGRSAAILPCRSTTACAIDSQTHVILVQVFAVSGALERAEARYAWLRKRLKSRASVWALFPPGWRVPQQVALSFCSITRAQLAEALDSKVSPGTRRKLSQQTCTLMHGLCGPCSPQAGTCPSR